MTVSKLKSASKKPEPSTDVKLKCHFAVIKSLSTLQVIYDFFPRARIALNFLLSTVGIPPKNSPVAKFMTQKPETRKERGE